MADALDKIMSFILEIDKIKAIKRKSPNHSTGEKENDAEHSWHLAMMALVLSGYSNEPIDLLKVIKMVLIHDIVEIDAGDTFLYDESLRKEKRVEEDKAAERIFGMLPGRLKEELLSLWREFETKETPESKFANAMDRLEPVIQNYAGGGGSWTDFKLSYEQVRTKQQGIKKGSEKLGEYVEALLLSAKEKGFFGGEKVFDE